MTNNVSKKKDIITSFVLSDVFKQEQYPVEILDLSISLTRNNSKLEKLNAYNIDSITNEMLHIIRNNIKKEPIDFATISFEIWTGLIEGDHEFSIRLFLVGKKISFYVNTIYKEIERNIIDEIGGYIEIKSKKVDKTTLQIELIPLNVDITSYVRAREKTLKEKSFYTDDVLKALLKDMTVLSNEDIKDPLYRYEL